MKKDNSLLVKTIRDFSAGLVFGGVSDYLHRSTNIDYPDDIEFFVGESIFMTTAYFLVGVLHSHIHKYPFNLERELAQSTAFFTGYVGGRVLSSSIYSLMNN